MSLLLRWQTREATVGPKETAGQPATSPLAKVDLDFELTPLILISEKDRPRLTEALSDLDKRLGREGAKVEVLIPSDWGVALEIPHPGLAEEALEEHLVWEIEKAVLGPLDRYRYGWEEGTGAIIHLAALRTKLSDLISQTVREAGFKVQGIYLDLEGYSSVNLGKRGGVREITLPAPVKETAPEPTPEPAPEPEPPPLLKPEPVREVESPPEQAPLPMPVAPTEEPAFEPADLTSLPRRRFPLGALAALVAIVLIAVVGIKLFTGPKPSILTEPAPHSAAVTPESTRVSQPAATTAVPETSATQVPSPVIAKNVAKQTQAEPAPGELAQIVEARRMIAAPMSRRLELMLAFLRNPGRVRMDLASFTARRFLIQVTASDSNAVRETLTRLQASSGLDSIKLKWSPSRPGEVSANLDGHFAAGSEASTESRPDSGSVTVLAQKHGLANRALVFTGSRENILAFLTDVAGSHYSFYRLVFMPWENEEYRLVLDI